ncbi:hypothetical protein PENSPDRAFT_381349 [Peniophora sp. CONT]|nr:hypothetical protein PENSPDRAFT_381349 [Peniophora sp. CONT]
MYAARSSMWLISITMQGSAWPHALNSSKCFQRYSDWLSPNYIARLISWVQLNAHRTNSLAAFSSYIIDRHG